MYDFRHEAKACVNEIAYEGAATKIKSFEMVEIIERYMREAAKAAEEALLGSMKR